MHGRAVPVGVGPTGIQGLRATLLDVVAKRYGPGFDEQFLTSESLCARIEPNRVFAVDLRAIRAARA